MKRQQVQWLRQQLSSWTSEELITQEQSQRILKRPNYLEALTGAPSSKLSRIFPILGGILIGVGSILFFSANWRAVPDALKLLMIFGGFLGACGFGYYKRFGPAPMKGFAAALFLTGSIIYGSGIHLVAQIYNLNADWRAGVLLWFLGTLPLAYALNSRPVLWLACGTLVLWLTESYDDGLVYLYQTAGALSIVLAVLHRRVWLLPGFSKIYFSVGCGLILTSMLFMSQFAPNDLAAGVDDQLFSIGLILAFYGTAWLFVVLRKSGRSSRPDTLLLLGLNLVLIPVILMLSGIEPPEAQFRLFSYLLLFGACLGAILYGVAVRVYAYSKLGTVFFLISAGVLYFDRYWEYLPRSIFYTAGGVALLVVGYIVEKKRRRMVDAFDGRVA